MKKRSIRRHHLNRMKNKAKKVYWFNEPDKAITLANHLASCSCSICGNPRKYYKEKTIQEKKFEISCKEE